MTPKDKNLSPGARLDLDALEARAAANRTSETDTLELGAWVVAWLVIEAAFAGAGFHAQWVTELARSRQPFWVRPKAAVGNQKGEA